MRISLFRALFRRRVPDAPIGDRRVASTPPPTPVFRRKLDRRQVACYSDVLMARVVDTAATIRMRRAQTQGLYRTPPGMTDTEDLILSLSEAIERHRAAL